MHNDFEFNQQQLSVIFEWLNIYYEQNNNLFVNETVKKLIIQLPFSFITQNEIYANKLNKNLKFFINLLKMRYLEYQYFSLCF